MTGPYVRHLPHGAGLWPGPWVWAIPESEAKPINIRAAVEAAIAFHNRGRKVAPPPST